MKYLLYIDANQYLRFYDSNSKQFKKLLKAIEEVKDDIFRTSQIKDEVERNKLAVFIASFNGYMNQFGVRKVFLPEHLERNADTKIKEWNTAAKAVADKVTKLKDLTSIGTELIDKIIKNRDEVSLTLNKILSRLKHHREPN